MARINHYNEDEFRLLANPKHQDVCVCKKAGLTNLEIAQRWGWDKKSFAAQRVARVFREACQTMDKNRYLANKPLPSVNRADPQAS